ncbi:MAG: MarR family transcriptional regulator [Dermatophilaceae bacterium]
MTATEDTANDLLRAAARLSRWASQSASFDMPFAQARLLALIDELGPVRISTLATADHSSQPTVTSQVQRLETAGWVSRESDPADARATLVSLTPHGDVALHQVRVARAKVLDPTLARLGGDGLARTRAAIDVLTELLDLTADPIPAPAPARKDI